MYITFPFHPERRWNSAFQILAWSHILNAGKYFNDTEILSHVKKKKKKKDKNTELKAILMDSYGVKQLTFFIGVMNNKHQEKGKLGHLVYRFTFQVCHKVNVFDVKQLKST